jgi:hypothetical protein
MHDIFETLQQTEMWYGQDDFPYRIDEMEQSHRYNVRNFLLRRAEHLYNRQVWREFRTMERAPEDVFDAWMAENEHSLPTSPALWLNNTPLMKALEQAIKNHGTIDGEVVDSHLVGEKELAHVGAALKRYVDKQTGEVTHDAGTITMAEAVQRTGAYRMKASPTGQLLEVEGESFECWKGHSDCDSADKCAENSYADWENSHDTTECGGMQNHCQLCMHIW